MDIVIINVALHLSKNSEIPRESIGINMGPHGKMEQCISLSSISQVFDAHKISFVPFVYIIRYFIDFDYFLRTAALIE